MHMKLKKTVFLALAAAIMICVAGRPVFAENAGDEDSRLIRLSLKEAVSLALKTNRNITAAANTLQSSQYSFHAARSDFDFKYRPSANIGVSDGDELLGAGVLVERRFLYGPRFQITPLVSRSAESTNGLVDLALEIPLMRGWGKTVNRDPIDQSAFGVRTSSRNLHQARVDTVIETVSAVYDIIEQKELIRLLEEQVREMELHSETARVKKRVELATAMDVYRAMIRLKDLQDNLSLARTSLAESENRLKQILALPLEQALDVTAEYSCQSIGVSIEAGIDLALINRPEIFQARDALAEAERQVDVAEHNLKPEFNLLLDYERLAEDDDFGFSVDDPEDRWQINLVSSTDWSRTLEKTRYRQRILDLENARLRLQALQDQIASEVRNQYEALESWAARIRIKEDQIRQARGKQMLSEIKFNHSMADNFDLIEAESELFRAKAGLLSAKTAFIVNQYQLEATKGKLIDQEGKLDLAL